MTVYTMNPVALVLLVLIIVAGIVDLAMEVFKGTKHSPIGVIFFFIVTFLGLADLYYVAFGGVGSSLSAWIVSHGGPGFWKYAIGVVSGHLFMPMQKITVNNEPISLPPNSKV